MIVSDVMTQLAERADTVDGLRCFGYPIDFTPPVPAFIVSYPDTIDYDSTYGRGMDRMTIPGVLLIDRISNGQSARDALTKYVAGDGQLSLKAVLESGTYTAFDVIRVARVVVDVVQLGTVTYLAATLTIEIAGQGSS